jgi:excinuclease ABC subunit B
LDADKEGFLRSETSLIQTIGRAARNVNGKVIMYADNITQSMERAIDETYRRRNIQMEYNRRHGITPESVKKAIHDITEMLKVAEDEPVYRLDEAAMSHKEAAKLIRTLEDEMYKAAQALEFEQAAELRDKIRDLRKRFTR